MTPPRRFLPAVAVLVAALAVPAAAVAAPPANDQRTAARGLSLPAVVDGTTTESTLEPNEPLGCLPMAGSVWYEVQAPSDDRIVVRLTATGDLDAAVDVFRRTRSQLQQVDCQPTDEEGRAELTFRPERGAIYAIRVGQRDNSVSGHFRLEAFAPVPPPRPPGPALPAGGAARTLDAVQDTADAWSMRLRAGTSYRINLAAHDETCVSLVLYPPGARDFESDRPVRRDRCGGYLLFTPGAGEGGRYTALVTARPRVRGPQRYRLQAARAGDDDTAPGLRIANYERAAGRLSGIDAVDLYRFDVARRSDLRLALGGGREFELLLLDDGGRRLERTGEGEITRPLRPGRYFAAVRSSDGTSGRYTLLRALRTITRTTIAIDGRRRARALPGETVRIGVRVRPGVSGPVTILIERFDPLAGWQFFRRVSTSASAGSAGVAFTPPTEGKWRATAVYEGTRGAAPSEAGTAKLLVARPLEG